MDLGTKLRLEITAGDLLSLTSALVRATREATLIDARKSEQYLTIEEACQMVRRDKVTLHRWNKTGVLTRNSLGLYRLSDIQTLLNK